MFRIDQKCTIKAIDLASTSKAILLHVQGVETLKPTVAQQKFCGFSLNGAQMGLQPMLLALSMELALKAWIVLDYPKKNVPRTHNLSKLFFSASKTTKKRLTKKYNKELAPFYPDLLISKNGLKGVLENAKHAFVRWRYIHELENAQFDKGVFSATELCPKVGDALIRRLLKFA